MKIGLLGHGVVGSGVAEILLTRAEELARAAGEPLELVKILDARDFSSLPYGGLFTREAGDIVGARGVDAVVECLGGVEPAGGWALRAAEAGQEIITSNKAMVVALGAEVEAAAMRAGGGFYAEASVAGGIPILRPLKMCLAGNRVLRIGGILNGTTNYILTRMQGGAAPFSAALAEAQAHGYAEADPTADVEGHDARRKLAILAHCAFGASLSDDARIPCEGIAAIGREDMQYAQALGRVIRLIALGERLEDGRWSGWVAPVMLPSAHPLAGVSDVFNAVTAKGDQVGEVMFYGRGAGREPTASAIVGDLIEAARMRGKPWRWQSGAPAALADSAAQPARWFTRVRADSAQSPLGGLLEGARQVRDVVPGEHGIVTPELERGALEAQLARAREKGLAHSAPIRYDSP